MIGFCSKGMGCLRSRGRYLVSHDVVRLLAMAVMFGVAGSLYAVDGKWTSTTGGLWSDTANWSGGAVANGSGSTANFGTIDATTDVTVHLDSARTISGLAFGDAATSTAAGWTLDNNGSAANYLVFAGGNTVTVNALGANKAATISLMLAGSAGLTKMGAGTLVLSGANSYTGTTTVTAGTLAYGANNVITLGDVFVNGGTLNMGGYSDSFGAMTVDGGGSVANSGTLASSGVLYVGKSGSGTIGITNGGKQSNTGMVYLGYNFGSMGVLTVDGAGSTWTPGGCVYIGSSGSGTLNVTHGGSARIAGTEVASASGSAGTLLVDGVGSTFGGIGSSLTVGGSGCGTFSITHGGCASSMDGNIAHFSGSKGTVTVDGAGSTWTNSGNLYVGNAGDGTMNILNGGSVSVAAATYVANSAGSTGLINFGANGGTLTTQSLFALPNQMTGVGAIHTCGLVSDLDMVFDSTDDLVQTLTFGQNVRVTLDLASQPDARRSLGAGLKGAGSLTIKNGTAVSSYEGCLGYGVNSTGTATVTGAKSTWTSNRLAVGVDGAGSLSIVNGGSVQSATGSIASGVQSTGIVTVDGVGSTWTAPSLYVGRAGNGLLAIINGGSVSSWQASLGSNKNSMGTVTVDGAGSKWANTYSISVGGGGIGRLNISNGGAVTAASVSINSSSLLTIAVDSNSSLSMNVYDDPITNNGTVRLLAGARAAATTYTPIRNATITNNGAWQSIGGTWNAGSRQFTVSVAATGSSGTEIAGIDLASTQRALVSDGKGWSVGASFLAQASTIDFTATAISGGVFTSLEGLLAAGESVRSGWEFSADNYAVSATNPVYLSLKVGAGFSADDLHLWHYANKEWTPYAASDLTYDGVYANFTATSFSGYAVSAVPEPSTIALLGVGVLGLLAYLRRRQRAS